MHRRRTPFDKSRSLVGPRGNPVYYSNRYPDGRVWQEPYGSAEPHRLSPDVLNTIFGKEGQLS